MSTRPRTSISSISPTSEGSDHRHLYFWNNLIEYDPSMPSSSSDWLARPDRGLLWQLMATLIPNLVWPKTLFHGPLGPNQSLSRSVFHLFSPVGRVTFKLVAIVPTSKQK